MEEKLVSFGNFLLREVENRSEAVRKSVTDADLRNWQHETGESVRPEWGTPYFQQGAPVELRLGTIESARVIAFHSFGSKHKYDVELKLKMNIDGVEVGHTTRLYNVDGMLLKDA